MERGETDYLKLCNVVPVGYFPQCTPSTLSFSLIIFIVILTNFQSMLADCANASGYSKLILIWG